MSFEFSPGTSAQQLADALPNGIAILNHQFEFHSVNRRFREIISCSSVNFRDCLLRSIHEDDHDRVAAIRYDEATRSGEKLRIEYRTRDPNSIWCAMAINKLNQTDLAAFGLGDQDGFICSITDITLEKRAEFSHLEAAQNAQERKKQQERFIDMISHEIRNPLSAILLCTEDILEATRARLIDEKRLMDITEAAETISLCITHQQRIVNDVLTYSKLDASMLSLSPQRVQPKRHLSNPLAIFRPEVRRHDIELEYKADSSYDELGIDWTLADIDRMNQVLINLLSNSIKFTAKSGNKRSIRVSIGASSERPASYPPNVVFFRSEESAQREDATNGPEWGDGDIAYIMIAVKDSGIGISDQAQKRLFERFNQATPKTESVYGGSGLGLNVCRKLCHLHGGEIGISSKEGEGSTFGFFLKVRRVDPVDYNNDDTGHRGSISGFEKISADIQALGNEISGVNKSTTEPNVSEPPALHNLGESKPASIDDRWTRHTRGLVRQVSEKTDSDNANFPKAHLSNDHDSKPRILLVEDNVINMRLLARRLTASGFDISEAFNGREAVEAVRSSTFDCIFMDQEMPLMDGYSATQEIRSLTKGSGKHIPIFGLTANSRAEQDAKMVEAGVDDLIHKPYSIDEILEKIRRSFAVS